MKKILIVDDNKLNRALLSNVLCKEYVILEAENGKLALDVLLQEKNAIAAVLLDIVMPEMNGYEALQHIRNDTDLLEIPVIMVTGSADEESRVKALALGANDFVVKPYNPDIIMHCLKNNIAMHENASLLNTLQRDRLTGLYSREFFFQKAAEMIAEKESGTYLLSCYDIDNFKLVNDSFGTLEGDRILQNVGKNLKSLAEKVGGICGRISGDNFAGLYPNTPEIIKMMDESHKDEFLRTDAHLVLQYSIGRCVVSDLSLPISAIYDRAYIAKQTVKRRYDKHIAYFENKMLENLVGEQQIVLEMSKALAEGQFETWFQPQYNHATGALIGAEALVRWRHPQKGLIAPFIFIPVFERNGFIYELDKFVWAETCRYLRKWSDEGKSPLPVSVNISRYDIVRSDFFDYITGLLKKFELPIDMLRLEITESAFAESKEQIILAVKNLVDFGFTVEIDDFGSGFSSLNTLKDVPAQIIKLDMKFLKNSDESARGGNIIESIVRMTKWLGMSVIAEGVETREQADYLLSVGCSYMQGYLYAKPMPAAEYEAHFKDIGKEKQLQKLEAVNNLNNNTFWEPNSIDTLIFNSYVGAACIFEYFNRKIELLRVNSKFTGILGYSAMSVEDTLKLDWISCLTPECLALVQKALHLSAETGEEFTDEYKFLNIPGCPPEVYLRTTMRVIATAGERMLVYCTCENTTAQRKAEERERIATEQIRSMVDDMPGGFMKISIDKDGKILPVYMNKEYFRMVGKPWKNPADGYSENDITEISPENTPLVYQFWEKLQKDNDSHRLRIKARRENGSSIWLDIIGRATKDSSGKTFLTLYFSDAAQKMQEDEIQNKLLDNLPCGAGVYELRNGKIRLSYQNKSYWELVGLNSEAFPDPAPMSAIHPEDVPFVMQELTAAIQENRDVHCDIRLRHLTRGFFAVHLTGRVVTEKNGRFLIFVTFTPCETQEEK